MTNFLEKNKDYLDKAVDYFHSIEEQEKWFNVKPKSRYYSFKYCFQYFNKKNPVIVELGTSRSFVDGRFEGCNSDDVKYWDKNDPEKWDWSAGFFTKVFSNLFPNTEIHTVDLMKNHIDRCKIMTNDKKNIIYHVASSEDFLNTFDKKIDQRVNEKTDESVKEKEDESVKEKADENIQEKTNVNANNKKYIKNQLFEIMKKFIDDIDSLPIHARHQAVTHSDLSAFANVVYSILQAFDDT